MKRLAIALMLPGLLILGFLAWQSVVKNASDSQNEAREIIMQNIEANAQPKNSVHPPVYPWTNVAPVAVIKPKKIKVGSKYVSSVGLISIPKIGVKNEPVVDDFTQAALDASLIGSMGDPGEGNFVVIAHVVGHGAVFKNLRRLRKNDLVMVKTASGKFTYRIRGGPVTIKDTDTEVLRGSSKKIISLITCAEVFHTDKRIAVFGDLVKRTP